MTGGPNEQERAIAEIATEALGGRRSIRRYYDEREVNSIWILTADNTPESGMVTYSTVGLSASQNLMDDKDIRVELCLVADPAVATMANVLATAAFFVMKDRWLAAPGVIFPDLLVGYDIRTKLRHVVWEDPFPWPALRSAEIEPGLTAHWLLGIPLHESERKAIIEDGFSWFGTRLEREQLAALSLQRQAFR